MNKRLVWHKKDVGDVIDLLVRCKSGSEVEDVFDKILTPREINDIARRHKALEMLGRGSSYTEVMQETGMSSNTISRLSNKCGYGFQKSSGLPENATTKKKDTNLRRKIKYKGSSL